MKVASRILIVGANEDRVGVLRFVLSNMGRRERSCCYRIVSASTSSEALSIINTVPIDLVLLLEPLNWIQDVIDSVNHNRKLTNSVVVVNAAVNMALYICDRCLYRPTMAELQETLSVLLLRKRGPRKGFKRLPRSEKVAIEEAVKA